MVPTSGFPVFRLSNGVSVGFWWESESQNIWFIYRTSELEEWRAPLNFQLGDTYVQFRGGPQEYLQVCLQSINARIRQLFPSLFEQAPPPTSEGIPQEILDAGPLTADFARRLSIVRLVDNQFVV